MRVRALDGTHDWLLGKGQNDYLTGNSAIGQNINTRLNSFLGNCFFDLNAGIDWFNLLGAKDELTINLSVAAVILNTEGVTALLQLSIVLNTLRALTISYEVQTTFSVISSTFQVNTNVVG